MRELREVWASEEGARAQPPLPLGCSRPRARAAGRGGARARRGWRTLLSFGSRGWIAGPQIPASSDPHSPAACSCGACCGSPLRDGCSVERGARTECAATGTSCSQGQSSRVNTARPRPPLGALTRFLPGGGEPWRIRLLCHRALPSASTLRTSESLLFVNRFSDT